MTKLARLQKEQINIKEEQGKIKKVLVIKKKELEDAKREHVRKEFESVLTERDEIHGTGGNYQIRRDMEGYSYKKDIVEIRFEKRWMGLNEDRKKALNLSIYSSNDYSNEALERMVTIGKLSELLLADRPGYIARFFDLMPQEKIIFKALEEEFYKLDRELDAYKGYIREEMVDEMMKELNTGISFESDKRPTLHITNDREVRFLSFIKITDISSSGKTANIETTQISNNWNNDKQIYEDVESKSTWKVRVSVLRTFITRRLNK